MTILQQELLPADERNLVAWLPDGNGKPGEGPTHPPPKGR